MDGPSMVLIFGSFCVFSIDVPGITNKHTPVATETVG